ncbi:MAG TPA: TIM-barrel domain-containing protein, partial [Minicystis sp.]|nr:TIM-barrel domain-containing protein [Minicystis sp.]
MRNAGLFFALALALAGCSGDDESVTPHDAGRSTYSGPSPVTIAGADAKVVIRTAPFGMQIEDAAGDVLLDTLDAVPDVPGDDAHAYGPLGGTHRDATILAPFLAIEGFDHVRRADDPWHHGASVASLTATGSHAELDLFDPADEATTFHVTIDVDGADVKVTANASDPSIDVFGQSFALPGDEHVFGLGERYVSVDHRGHDYYCWVEEGGIPQGEKVPPGPGNPGPNGPSMTHAPIPFYLSTKGFGVWLETTYRTVFSFGAEDAKLQRFEAEGPSLSYHVLVHADPRDTIAQYTALTGRAHLGAPWNFGPRRRVDRGALVNGLPEEEALRAYHVPTTAADDATHFLPIGSEVGHESDFAAWTAKLHGEGFKAIAYYNPYVSVTAPETKDLAKTGRAHDWFVKTTDGKEFDMAVVSAGPQTVATIDLTDAAAVKWYQSILERAFDLGYDGWMLDFGEYIPPLAKMHDGRLGWEAHNAFPDVYQHAVADYVRKKRGDDYFFFARSGYVGSQRWPSVLWSGDPASSYDDAKGLPAQVRAAINAGMSGFPYWGSDISGYSCFADPPADKTLYLRWAEFGALSPDMHDENACAQKPAGEPDKWTLWSDAETTAVYGRYASLHTRLNPYLYAAAAEAARTGMPIVRHPFLLHPTEPEAYGVEFEYYFGPALYVAPIVERGATTRTLWLPPGLWFDFWTEVATEGGRRVTRAAPLDELPLWLRSGGIVAMLDPAVETLAPGHAPGVVTADDVKGVLDVRAGIDPK